MAMEHVSANFLLDIILEVDIISLLETDAARPYIGSNDIASWLSERLRMYVDYGPGPKEHTWGSVNLCVSLMSHDCAYSFPRTMLLSKYPILKSEHHLLPSPDGK